MISQASANPANTQVTQATATIAKTSVIIFLIDVFHLSHCVILTISHNMTNDHAN